jgi:hypothetical protein
MRIAHRHRQALMCAECETLVQAPVAPHIIDKGIPTTVSGRPTTPWNNPL